MSGYGTKNYANESEKYRKEVGKFQNQTTDKYVSYYSKELDIPK